MFKKGVFFSATRTA